MRADEPGTDTGPLTPRLEVEGLVVRYGPTPAIDDVDLRVAPGEIVCVLGASGSGKSTLLRAVAGLETPEKGIVRRDGVDITHVPAHLRGLGLMFQEHVLFPHRDVLGNVVFGMRMHGTSRGDARNRASDLLALVGLAGFESRRVHELSGGEQQRVALARALAPAPALLMLDEPLGSLDRPLRERLVAELRDLFHQLGQSTVFVTHDQDEAFALADRLVILDAGRVVQDDVPTRLWERPANVRVARFLGWNVLVHPQLGQVGVRPEHVRLEPAPTGPPTWCTGTVGSVTFHRDHFVVQVSVDGASVDAAVSGGPLPDPGATVSVVVPPDAAVPLPD